MYAFLPMRLLQERTLGDVWLGLAAVSPGALATSLLGAVLPAAVALTLALL